MGVIQPSETQVGEARRNRNRPIDAILDCPKSITMRYRCCFRATEEIRKRVQCPQGGIGAKVGQGGAAEIAHRVQTIEHKGLQNR